MTSQMYLKSISTLTFLLLMLSSATSKADDKKDSRPNILFIMTDQQTAKAMGNRDNNWVQTPNMDRLANNGTSFTRAYCPQPLCGPSRSSMLTGKYPHQVNATVNRPEKNGFWDDDIKIMGTYLKEAGYNTAYVGKWHLPIPVADKERHGFNYIANTTRRDWQDASIPADCGLFLKNTSKEKPFFLVASFINPHDICEWARGQKLRMDNINEAPMAEKCPPVPTNFEIASDEPSILREVMRKSWAQYPTMDWEDSKWQQYMWAYYQLVGRVDFYIGRVLESLERSGFLDNTIIIFTSDHGDGNASHKLNQKQVLYEEATNVPFIISHLTKGERKVNTNTLINIGLDLLPTMCDYAEANIPNQLDGLSIRPLVDGEKDIDREYIYLQTEFAEDANSYGVYGRAILKDNYKYVVYSEGKNREQLYDLQKDPGEMTNLRYRSEYQKIYKELYKQLKIWQETTNDTISILP